MKFDLIIIGAGPAALTAAIYAARAGLKVKIFERGNVGGELSNIAHIANFPGFAGKGSELAAKMRKQVEDFGVKIEYGEVTKLSHQGNYFNLEVDGETIIARSVLVATGSEPKPLSINVKPPVSYCATCDAPLYKDKQVIVVGGGNSAVSGAIILAKLAEKVIVICHSTFKAEKFLIDNLKKYKNVIILENTEPDAEQLNKVDGVFVFIGHRPATTFLPKEVLNQDGFIITNEKYMTNIPGLFAAGDVRQGAIKQVVVAAAEGATAALNCVSYLE